MLSPYYTSKYSENRKFVFFINYDELYMLGWIGGKRKSFGGNYGGNVLCSVTRGLQKLEKHN